MLKVLVPLIAIGALLAPPTGGEPGDLGPADHPPGPAWVTLHPKKHHHHRQRPEGPPAQTYHSVPGIAEDDPQWDACLGNGRIGRDYLDSDQVRRWWGTDRPYEVKIQTDHGRVCYQRIVR
jgi:hypothetical protein